MAIPDSHSNCFTDTLSNASTEDFDVCCDPCLTADRNVEASGFCTECQENLCKACLDAHKRTKASRHHKLLGQARSTHAKGTCTEQCQIHKTEVIMFFCPTHEAVGCNDCMIVDHMTCYIEYIPDICAGTTNSHEFQNTLQEVAKTICQADDITKGVQFAKSENKTMTEEAIRDIETFQKKITDRIELLTKTIIQQAQAERSSRDTNDDQVLNKAVQESTALTTIQTTMLHSQTNNQDALAFTIMKQLQAKMKALNFQSIQAEQSIHKIKCSFEPNSILENALSSKDGLGKLRMRTDSDPLDEMASVQSLTLEEEITVRTKFDTKACSITCCAVISPDRILLADFNNDKLKILDLCQNCVIDEKTVNMPYDIAILPTNQVAITLLGKFAILILETTSQLATLLNIPVNRQCYGIVYHNDLLYVVCQRPSSLLVIDMHGNVQRDVTLQTATYLTFQNPLCIAISHDRHHLYISDWYGGFVAHVTHNGQVTAVYKNDEMKQPRGLLVLQDGSVIVCCTASGTIHHVSSDLKIGHTLTRDVTNSKSICYHPDCKKIIVGSDECDTVKVFTANICP